MSEETNEIEEIPDEEIIIHFCVGSVPIDDAIGISAVLNWGEENGFELVLWPTVLIPPPAGRKLIVPPGAKAPGLVPALMFYYATDKETFQEYFGEPYTLEILAKVPAIIEERNRPAAETT